MEKITMFFSFTTFKCVSSWGKRCSMVVRLEILFLNYTEGLFGLQGGNFNDLQEKKITQCLYCNIVLWIMLFALQKCLNKHAHNKNMFKSCNQKSLYTHFWLPLTRLLCVRVHSLSKALKRDWKWLDSQGIFALIQFLHICTSNSAHLCFWRVERQKTIMSGYFF